MIIEGMHYNPNCNCKQCVKTTKLNNTMTQKCCDKSTTQPWQERFDNTFGIYWSKNSNGTFGMFDEYPSKVIILNGDGIKKFIQQELDRQRQEIREKIDNMEVNKPNSISEEMLYEIKKTALKECKRIILKDILENI
jgi:hypothetical protein